MTAILFKINMSSEKRKATDVCTICMCDISEPRTVTQCNHVFHKGCISKWIIIHGKCPLCRRPAKIKHTTPIFYYNITTCFWKHDSYTLGLIDWHLVHPRTYAIVDFWTAVDKVVIEVDAQSTRRTASTLILIFKSVYKGWLPCCSTEIDIKRSITHCQQYNKKFSNQYITHMPAREMRPTTRYLRECKVAKTSWRTQWDWAALTLLVNLYTKLGEHGDPWVWEHEVCGDKTKDNCITNCCCWYHWSCMNDVSLRSFSSYKYKVMFSDDSFPDTELEACIGCPMCCVDNC